MIAMPPSHLPRCAVVDLGSNSVRLVVFEGQTRNPMPILNEKAVLRLGRGLDKTGRLNQEGLLQALTVMQRYHAVAQAMRAEPLEVLATAAVRDAINGPEFVAALRERMPGVSVTVLSGIEEAAYSADGMLCSIPAAHGILADIGGGSLEVIRLIDGARGASQTLRLGVIRLAERSAGDIMQAQAVAEKDMRTVPWLTEAPGSDLYLVGGAFRALARVHMAQTNYPLNMVHHYTINLEEARELARLMSTSSRKVLERMPAMPRRRIDDLPFAAVVLRRLLRVTNARRIVFSASGLREGWFMRRMSADIRAQDPLLSAARDLAATHGRDFDLPPALLDWTLPLFPVETVEARQLREAVCWMSDIGSRDHPEFRAEQAFLRVFRQQGLALDHRTRAFLAVTVAIRYDAELNAPFLHPALLLLDTMTAARAELLGIALRLGYTLSAGTKDLLTATRLQILDTRLILRLRENSGVFAGESISRRLGRLALGLGLAPVVEPDVPNGVR